MKGNDRILYMCIWPRTYTYIFSCVSRVYICVCKIYPFGDYSELYFGKKTVI